MCKYMPALLAVTLQAAVIRGVVVENLTSRPLARAVVVLVPIAGTAGSPKAVRTSSAGGFEFDALAAGSYILRASRKGFLPLEYGQKRWNAAGRPIVLEQAGNAFLDIRLQRYGAIAGAVIDENGVGLPDYEVVARRMTEPPEFVAQVTTDDRGVYRLHGLEPGTYVVQTGGMEGDDGSYLPTFSRETVELAAARTVSLTPDQQADDTEIRPVPGRLFRLAVGVQSPVPDPDITITVSSAMGRKTVKAFRWEFPGLAPGEYEVYCQQGALQGASQRVTLGRDAQIGLLLPQTPVSVAVVGGPGNHSGELRVRRKDLAGVGPTFTLPLADGRAALPRGRWEVMLLPPAGYYVSRFSPMVAGGMRADGWNEVSPANASVVRFMLSQGAGAVGGVVKSSGDPVAGAPVYLEGYEPNARRRIGELWTARTDSRGQYRFEGLAPGTYRILSTFEYAAPDLETMDLARARQVSVAANGVVSGDLELYVIR